jgi:hypothetical protein
LIDVEDFAFCGLIDGEENVVADEMLLIADEMLLIGIDSGGCGLDWSRACKDEGSGPPGRIALRFLLLTSSDIYFAYMPGILFYINLRNAKQGI